MTSLKVVCMQSGIRKESNSGAVMKGVMTLLPEHTEILQLPIGNYPLYNQDLEQENMPILLQEARDQIRQCDAVIIVTSEYNHGIPGALKNALDWVSRPVRASAMMGKPVFFLSQSSGALGGVRAQYQLRETLASMLCELVPAPEIAIPSVESKIKNGHLQDATTLEFIATQLHVFLDAIQARKSS